jgi:hypothetical protein
MNERDNRLERIVRHAASYHNSMWFIAGFRGGFSGAYCDPSSTQGRAAQVYDSVDSVLTRLCGPPCSCFRDGEAEGARCERNREGK